MSKQDKQVDGGRLLKAVEAIAIAPADAKDIVAKYRRQVGGAGGNRAEQNRRIAQKIVARYSKLAGGVGGLTGLTGVIPGVGTAIAAVGGATADAITTMKLQVDMCMCLAETYGYDLNSEDAKHLSFLIAAGGALEQAGAHAVAGFAGKAGVRLLRQYLRGAALQMIRQLFRRLGIVFTRKALEKALPFGIGVVVGAGGNYALSKYVGAKAIDWFVLDAELPRDDDEPPARDGSVEAA